MGGLGAIIASLFGSSFGGTWNWAITIKQQQFSSQVRSIRWIIEAINTSDKRSHYSKSQGLPERTWISKPPPVSIKLGQKINVRLSLKNSVSINSWFECNFGFFVLLSMVRVPFPIIFIATKNGRFLHKYLKLGQILCYSIRSAKSEGNKYHKGWSISNSRKPSITKDQGWYSFKA